MNVLTSYMPLFISNTFISNTRLKLSKIQVKSKQQPEAEHLLFENHSFFIHIIIPKVIEDILKNIQKTILSVSMRLYDSI